MDTHLHRIVNKLHWVTTKNPLQTEKALMKWLPHTEWARINPLLVGFGQLTSTAGGYKRCADTTSGVLVWHSRTLPSGDAMVATRRSL